MKPRIAAIGTALLATAAAIIIAAPSVYPTGTTIFQPDKTWNGYTILSPLAGPGAVVIDMNGNVVKQWDGYNSSAGGPARILPGGIVLGAAGANPPRQEATALVAKDFDGKVLWQFDHNLQIEVSDAAPGQAKGKGKGKGKAAEAGPTHTIWSTRQHHDWQRADFPAGYYAPGATPAAQGANTLLLTHINHINPKIAPDVNLEDDRLIEIDATGKILWEWVASDYVDEFHFSEAARKSMASATSANPARGSFDWLHVNSAAYVGPNKWYDAGDTRFSPTNVIISSREASLVAIIARNGSVVWQIGPDFTTSPELRAIRQIIGQHNAHFIPKGLPGAGNVMIFDNGGASGYGLATSNAPKGTGIYARPTSRVLEIDPVTLKLVWSYTNATFFATNISGAQRLANGNTLVTEGPDGRIFEVTTDGQIVWEFINPNFGAGGRNSVYRAYRMPYDWIPQLKKPTEKAVTPPNAGQYRVP